MAARRVPAVALHKLLHSEGLRASAKTKLLYSEGLHGAKSELEPQRLRIMHTGTHAASQPASQPSAALPMLTMQCGIAAHHTAALPLTTMRQCR